MKSTVSQSSNNFPTTSKKGFLILLLTTALILTGAVFTWFVRDIYQSRYVHSEVDKRILKISELRASIIYLDETLTMSAKMAAATGGLEWEKRYREFEPQLNQAIEEAENLSAHPNGNQSLTQTNAANLKLIEMENRAFASVREGRAEDARRLLFSDEYAAQKKIYADGMRAFDADLKNFQEAQLNNHNDTWLVFLVVITLVFSLMAWLATVRSLFNSHKNLLFSITEKEQTAEALQQSETRFRQLFENANDIIFTIDLQGNFTSINRAGEDSTGYVREEVLGMNSSQIIAPENLDLINRMLTEKLETDAPTKYETEIITKKGDRLNLEVNSRLIVEGGKAVGIQGIARDITESKQAAENKRKSEQYQNLFKHAGDAILIFEPDSEIILEVNDKACEMYGRQREDFVGRSLKEMSQNINRGTEELEKLLHDGVYEEFESVHLRGDNTPLNLVINAAVIEYQGKSAILTINRDVSVRKQMEEDLREREQHLMSVTNSAQDAIVSADNRGNIIFWNEGARKTFGYDQQEALGKSLSILMPERYREVHTKGMRRYSETGEKCVIGNVVELHGLRKDGSEFPLELSLGVWETAKGKYFSGIMRDITERRKSEQLQMLRSHEVALRSEISLAFAEGSQSLKVNLTNCAESIVSYLDATLARIWMFNEKENVLELQASAGIHTHIDGAHARVPIGQLKIGLIAQEREPHITNDILNDERVGDKEWARQNELVSFAGYPLMIDGKLIGVLAMFARHELVEETLDTLASVADILAQSIERKRAGEAIIAKNNLLLGIIEGTSDSVFVKDLEGRYLTINSAGAGFYGKSIEDFIGRTDYEIYSPEVARSFAESDRQVLTSGKTQIFEGTATDDDGSLHAYLVTKTAHRNHQGEIIGLIAISHDITERKLAENVIKESERRYRLLGEGIMHQVWTSKPDGKLDYVNRRTLEYFGTTMEQAINDGFVNIIHPDDLPICGERWTHSLETGEYYEVEFRLRGADGSYRWHLGRATAGRDADGKIVKWFGTNTDINDKKYAEEELQKNISLLTSTFEATADGILVVNSENEIEIFNQNFVEIWGLTADTLKNLSSADTPQIVLEQMKNPEDYIEKTGQIDVRNNAIISDDFELKNGRIYERHSRPQKLNGQVVGRVFNFRDVTERKRAEQQLLYDAFHDGLTELANRTLFTHHLQMTIERCKRGHNALYAVLFLDFDRFKFINDSLGHTEGDQFLKLAARRLESALRSGDLVARIGGDEFTILLTELDDESDAVRVAERIQEDLKTSFELGGREIFVSVSIGIAFGSDGYKQAGEILRDADIAMYRAKGKGRARYQVFDRSMHEQASKQLQLETEMRHALEREEFLIHYQPIMNLENETLMGFEALVRWKHSERGMIPPFEFIPAAEENNLILPLGQWILQESCRQMRRWQDMHPSASHLTISVNLSGKQFSQYDLAEQIAATLNATGLDPHCLKLEITESHLMENSEAAITMLNRLRALGVELSLDDFGTGYSSLSYLHRLPVSYLKVDRSFVMRMLENEENAEIVSTIIKLAQNLKMKVVAEGIETAEQLAYLKSLRCEYGQGYLFSKPLEAQAAKKFIEENSENSLQLVNHPIINIELNM